MGKAGENAYNDAVRITESAILVVEILNGNFSHVKDGTVFDLSGMNAQQKQLLLDALKKGHFGL